MRRAVLFSLLLVPAVLCPVSLGQTVPPAAGPQAAVTLTREPGLRPAVAARLRALPAGVKAGVLVRDLHTGQVLEASAPDQPFIPASAMKTVTGAAVLVSRQGSAGWWSTELTVPAAQAGQATVDRLTLRGSADPTFSVSDGRNSLRELARQAYAHGLRRVAQVQLDETPLNAATFQKTVYAEPMPAVRVREWETRPPSTPAEARTRLGAALIYELRRAGVQVERDTVTVAPAQTRYVAPARQDKDGQQLPPDPVIPRPRRPEQGVASVRSGSVVPFLDSTLRPSDNARAEALLATLAVGPGGSGTLSRALAHERDILTGLGIDTARLRLADGSGLSRENRLTPRALTDLLKVMYDLPYPVGRAALPDTLYRERRNAFVEALPLAGTGEALPGHGGRGGTLAQRLVGSGLDVRAKTGTLPGVSSLAGYVTASSGRLVVFAIMMNGPETTNLLDLRDIQDRMVREIAAAH